MGGGETVAERARTLRTLGGILVLGVASGLPNELTKGTLQAWLVSAGYEPGEIGLMQAAGIAYAFKFLWSPLVDRYSPPWLGRRRGWIAGTLLGVVYGTAALALVDPARGALPVALAAACLAALGATYDLALNGLACDAHHITRPHPEGKGSIHAMRQAIERSGLRPEQVDFVNAHGTGTPANDQVESLVMREVFGARRVPISSIKSMLGHCMGAASALEAVACVETLLSGLYPPTIHYEEPDPECDVDVVANQPRAGKADVVLNNSLAFGGYDAVVSFARPGVLPEPSGAR